MREMAIQGQVVVREPGVKKFVTLDFKNWRYLEIGCD